MREQLDTMHGPRPPRPLEEITGVLTFAGWVRVAPGSARLRSWSPWLGRLPAETQAGVGLEVVRLDDGAPMLVPFAHVFALTHRADEENQ